MLKRITRLSLMSVLPRLTVLNITRRVLFITSDGGERGGVIVSFYNYREPLCEKQTSTVSFHKHLTDLFM